MTEMSNIVAVDFETYYSKKLKYSVKLMIAEQYCKSHHFDCYMMSATDGTTTWSGHPKDFNWVALDGKIILSHNRYFDEAVWNRLHELGVCPKPNYKVFHCTANLTAYLCNRRSLDMAVEHLYKVKLDKSDRANAVEKHWPADFSTEQQKSMLKYACNDVIWCRKIWMDYSAQWPEGERRLSGMTIDQGMRGVQIDTVLLDQYLIQSHEMRRSAELQIPWLQTTADAEEDDCDSWDDVLKIPKPTSTKCIAEMCRRSGIPECPVKSDDEELYDEWENTYAPAHPWIRAVTAWRSINKLHKTFSTVKERLRVDGTLPFALKYMGAHTGRWSGDAKINFQNMRKKPILCTQEGLLETEERKIDLALDRKKATGEWPPWVKYAIDFRNLIIPRPGTKMIACDLSQIEPRILAWLAGNKKLLSLLLENRGMSLYEAFARDKLGWTGGKLKDENPTLYSLAKAQVLALGYQAGGERFIEMAWDLARVDVCKDDPEFIDETQPNGEVKKVSGYGSTSKKIVADFRAQNKDIVALWAKLDAGFKGSVGTDFEIQLPSGRSLRYQKVRCEVRIEKDDKTGLPRRKSVFTADVGGRRNVFYGGKLVENATQAAARDVFSFHLLLLEDSGFTILFTAHDEVILECPIDKTVKEVEELMSTCPDWLRGCSISAEGKEVLRYEK